MFDKNVSWVNQDYFYYTDKAYNTQSTLEISISMNTSDYKRFSPPNLMLSIRNNNDNSRRSCSLKFEDLYDILFSINQSNVLSNPELAFSQSISIDKKFKDKILKIVFQKSKQNDEKIVIFRIIFNESDFGTVVLPFEKFYSLHEMLVQFKNNFIYISLELPKRLSNIKLSDEIESIKRSVQTLSLQPHVIPEESQIEEPSITDFDKFVGNNIDKVELPDIDKAIQDTQSKNHKPQNYTNNFIEKILKNDINVFESMIMSMAHTDGSPTELFVNTLKEHLNIDDYLPGISEKDKKSFEYISKYLFKAFFKNYLENNVSIPIGIPVIKYSPTHVKPENIELAYDLLFISIFIRCVRNKLETKISDSTSNKAILNIASRCFLDILSFSFLNDKDPKIIKTCIMSRFKNYKECGFLDNFLSLPEQYNSSEITDKDFDELTESVCEKMINSDIMISDLHEKMFEKNDLKLPPQNNYESEQILNKIIDLELSVKFGNDINSLTDDKDLIELLGDKVKKSKISKTSVYNNSLHRFISEVDFIKQIPSGIKDKFIEYVKDLDGDYDYKHSEFIIDELGDDIVKAIYVWNESDSKKRYSNYRSEIEECMDKKLIIAKIKGNESIEDNTGSEGEWI